VNAPVLKTRYDVKSVSSGSLYGSAKPGIIPGTVSLNENNKTTHSVASSKRIKIKKFILKKIFSDDDSYANGEYDKENELNMFNQSTVDKKDNQRENWSGKFDFILSALGYAGNFSFEFFYI
jgi:hypothetical protein